jgi:hypothetical protein
MRDTTRSTPDLAPPTGRPRWAAALAAPLRRAGRWFYYAPRGVQVGLALTLAAALVGGAYYGGTQVKGRVAEWEAAAAWREFDVATRDADPDRMRAALDRVLTVRPGDPLAARRRAALEAGAADLGDPEVALSLMTDHARHGRLPDAAREARKVLAEYPGHWRALCVLAHHALLVERDPAGCRRWLDRLPAPDDPAARLDASGLVTAARLSAAVGREPGPLRTLVVRRVLPTLRGAVAETAPPADKVQFVECYLESFAGPDPPLAELAGYWAAAARITDLAVSEAAAAGDLDTLVRLGQQSGPLFTALTQLLTDELVAIPRDPADEYARRTKELAAWFDGMARDIAGRSRRAWLAVREKAPMRFEPYYGLADLAVREENRAEGVRVLREGLAACGPRVELLEPLTRLLSPADGLALARVEAEKAGTDPAKWCLVASAALAAGERQQAIEACANARRFAPNHPWACTTEAGLWLENGHPERALDLLLKLGRPALLADPLRVRQYARALVEAGTPLGEIGETADELAKAHQPALPVAFLLGVLEARRPDADRAKWVVARADALLAARPTSPLARRLLAEARYRQSELADPPWDPDLARIALREYDGLPTAARAEPGVAAAVAALHLKALKNPAAALRAAAPLRVPANALRLAPAQAEVLAAVLTANGDPKGAVQVLGRVCALPTDGGVPGGTAGCWVQLALAHRAAGQPAEARAALDMVAKFPDRSPREEAEWRDAQQRLGQNARDWPSAP